VVPVPGDLTNDQAQAVPECRGADRLAILLQRPDRQPGLLLNVRELGAGPARIKIIRHRDARVVAEPVVVKALVVGGQHGLAGLYHVVKFNGFHRVSSGTSNHLRTMPGTSKYFYLIE